MCEHTKDIAALRQNLYVTRKTRKLNCREKNNADVLLLRTDALPLV